MSNEQPTLDTMIGRRQALCTFAGFASAVAGFSLLGIGTANAAGGEANDANDSNVDPSAHTETVTADEASRQAESVARSEHERAMLDGLFPADLEMGKWSLDNVHAPRLGAIAVVMRTPVGEAFQVDVLRRDSNVSGIAETKNFSLFVANSGNGSKATDEWQARGAMVLAHHLRRTEVSGVRLPELLTFAQRGSQHPLGDFGVLG